VLEWWPSTRGEKGVRHKEPDHLLKSGEFGTIVSLARLLPA
jgi:hypothetical protein